MSFVMIINDTFIHIQLHSKDTSACQWLDINDTLAWTTGLHTMNKVGINIPTGKVSLLLKHSAKLNLSNAASNNLFCQSEKAIAPARRVL
jgi:hypothetical protein